jgi:hypothetical protein
MMRQKPLIVDFKSTPNTARIANPGKPISMSHLRNKYQYTAIVSPFFMNKTNPLYSFLDLIKENILWRRGFLL